MRASYFNQKHDTFFENTRTLRHVSLRRGSYISPVWAKGVVRRESSSSEEGLVVTV